MRGFSYVLPRDYGFAPNPFGDFCTLATCKPQIRGSASVGDWVIGCGSAMYDMRKEIVYAMQVSEKITFDEYWLDERFQYKKPVMNGSLKQMYGDNIYHRVDNLWCQADSHHSKTDGSVNHDNLDKDTSYNSVLISSVFYYFGQAPIELPADIQGMIAKVGRGTKAIGEEALVVFVKYLEHNYETGISDFPMMFEKFERYDGKS